MSLHSLLPVPVAGVEQRPLLVHYSALAVKGNFADKELPQVAYGNRVHELRSELHSFNSHRGLRRRAAQCNDYSSVSGDRFRKSGCARSSVKTNLRLSGTYTMDGELTIIDEEKGVYVDRFF